MMEEYKGMAAMLFLLFKFVRSETKESCFKNQCASRWRIFISMVDVILSIVKKTVKNASLTWRSRNERFN